MKIGLVIYGSLETLSGGYFYDRQLVEFLRGQGDTVEIISLPWRNYPAHLGDTLSFRLPPGLDLLIQDELNHPSLLAANRRPHPYPVVSLVHHLRASEKRPAWQNLFYRAVEKAYLQSVDAFLFNSETTKKVVTALTGASRPSLVAYPPTDRFAFASISPAQVLAKAQEAPPLRILFVGNLIPRKGLHVLLEALSSLPPGMVALEVVGSLDADRDYAISMYSLVERYGLQGQVHFAGPLTNAPLAKKFSQAQVLVVPSSYEGFGIVYLEGMSFGLPAIGTDLGAAPEVITHGSTGYIIPAGSWRHLAEHLRALAKDPALRVSLAQNALARYALQPSWQQTATEIRAFLLSLR